MLFSRNLAIIITMIIIIVIIIKINQDSYSKDPENRQAHCGCSKANELNVSIAQKHQSSDQLESI
jgi:hypothetical protein